MVRLLVPEKERPLFDSWAVELLQLSVDHVLFYVLSQNMTVIDPLYQEVTDDWSYDVYSVTAWVRKPDIVVDKGDAGKVVERSGLCVIARKTIEDLSMPYPKIGDVVKHWDMFFDVIKVEPKGFVSDANFYTHVQCEIVRRTRYMPDIKVKQ